MSSADQLKKLNKKMLACSKCALRSGCIQVVPGEGSAGAEIMFIGEGPGKKEDETGKPFIGSAGKFLNEMLASIKLNREGVYIANVVKCRPPKNRDPLPEEASACWPWLLKQIEIIEPKLIVFLGRHSMNRFFPDKKISEAHGKLFIEKLRLNPKGSPKQQHFFALYHPAAALYNGSMRETLKKDFKKIPKALDLARNKGI